MGIISNGQRVVPSKATTIPRLELAAAKMSAIVGNTARKELSYTNLSISYWVDSMIVLGYITNEVKRFRTYVTNRVKTIREYTEKEDWHYVHTESNPADHASRGIAISDTEKVEHFLHGPSFLWKPEEKWNIPDISDIPDDDPEILSENIMKCNSVKIYSKSEEPLILRLGNRISCWYRLIRVLATMMIFIGKCQKKSMNIELTAVDLENSRLKIIKMIQQEFFSTELQQLTNKRNKLSNLNPFVDSDGILRVGGRLLKSQQDYNIKHPIILPNKSSTMKRLVAWHHKQVEHEGRTSTINELRENGYWIIGCNTLVRSLIHRCYDCRANRGKASEQRMADLPEDRTISDGPFLHNGLDMFGRYIIKDGRKELKRWGILFTCLSCRDIHLESVVNADTDSFILALRRFMSRRGTVNSIRSDNGGNLVGASNELENAYKELNHEKIQNFLLTKQCDMIVWKRNPPESSHKGGIWERQIRSAKNILNHIRIIRIRDSDLSPHARH